MKATDTFGLNCDALSPVIVREYEQDTTVMSGVEGAALGCLDGVRVEGRGVENEDGTLERAVSMRVGNKVGSTAGIALGIAAG